MANARLNPYAHRPGHRLSPHVPQRRLSFIIQSVPLFNQKIPIRGTRYHIDKKLGKGGFGEVYAAYRLPDNKPVAIKVVSLATMNNEVAVGLKEAFLNEVEMAKRLAKTSRHIVHMYDFDFHENGLTFIVMELGEQDFEKYLSTRPPLSSGERHALWRQLVNIAITLYNREIVHLDIKPNNLVMFPGNVVKLVDLGIAQKAQRTRVGYTGTVPYSAPEVTTVSYFHITTNSRKSDIWSWGAVLYRMTYNAEPDYTVPCFRPPANQHPARDPHLLDVLRRTLVINPRERLPAPSLAQHPYTKTH